MPTFEQELVMKWVPKDGDTFIDVGANDGEWCGLLQEGYKNIIAIEPHPGACLVLSKLLKEGSLIAQLAAYNESGKTLTLNLFKESVWSTLDEVGTRFDGKEPDSTVRVKTITIDDLVAKATLDHIDLIKVDVEGAEVEVLEGAKKTLEEHKPPIVVEIHGSTNGEYVSAILKAVGYQHFKIIRHPHYEENSDLYLSHYWIYAL